MRAILTFHSVDDSGHILSCSISRFRHILEALEKKNIPVVSLDTLLQCKSNNGVALTFDDGMQSVYTHAMPLLQAHAAVAHLFLSTSLVGKTALWPDHKLGVGSYKMLNWTELDELQKNNVIIDSHTHTHPDLTQISAEELEEECDTADTTIKQRTGRPPLYFAYPFGRHNKDAREFIRKRYRAATTTELGYLGADNFCTLPRLDSFYLGSNIVSNIDNILVKSYLGTRSVLRSIRGSQTRPDE